MSEIEHVAKTMRGKICFSVLNDAQLAPKDTESIKQYRTCQKSEMPVAVASRDHSMC